MVRFEELQELWQNQPQSQAPAVAEESRSMAAALRRFRRRQYVVAGIKLAVIVCMIGFVQSQQTVSVRTLFGDGLVLAGIVTMIVTDWRIQSAIVRLDFTRPALTFVDATLERLRDPNAPFWRTGWLSIALVVGGMNLMLADGWATKTLLARIGSHALISAYSFAAFAVGLKVRAKRYVIEYKPLVERLTAMKATLKENGE